MTERYTVAPSMAPQGPDTPAFVDGTARLVVAFRESVEIPYVDDAERHLPEPLQRQWSDLLRGNTHIHLRRLFSALEPAQLEALVKRAQALDRDYAGVDFRKFFAVEIQTGVDGIEVRRMITEWSIVESAYWDPPGNDPMVNPEDEDPDAGWFAMQGYLNAAPDGIDAKVAWPLADGSGFPGGDGAGVGVIEFEQGWQLNHLDLAAHGINLLYGSNLASSAYHGNGALGVLCARDNTEGCIGIAPWAAPVNVVSYYQKSRADALSAAIAALSAGDVLVVNAQLGDVTIGGVTWYAMPIEVLQPEFEMIRLATALGIVVVEAAGNSGTNLDDFVDGKGRHALHRANQSLGFKDSGAIMVSAATATAPHAPIYFYGGRIHHFGSRIDCYAWGEAVTTLSEVSYTNNFSDTSAATPIIGGAAIILQGIAKAQGRTLTPSQVRRILSNPDNGTASLNGALDGLGVMPDFEKILRTNDVLSLLPDVYLRDYVGDAGDPHLGWASMSPDVIVVPYRSGDPSTDFADATVLVDARVEAGQRHFAYLRAWNRGGADADNVTATVYWANASTLLTPDQWNLLGSTVFPRIAAGNIPTLSPPLEWPSDQVPPIGHYCFVAVLDHPDDPSPGTAELGTLDWAEFRQFVRNNNNITWRNFNIVDDVPDSSPGSLIGTEWVGEDTLLSFIAAGAPDRAREMQLTIVAQLPESARLRLQSADQPAEVGR